MLKPRLPVRRFDVFAEYNRQEAMQKGTPEDEAAGYGLWVAKVVASRRFGASIAPQPPRKGAEKKEEEEKEERPKEKWRTLGDEEQTDELFEKEIVNRMGRDFYYDVFVPAIEQAIKEGKSYQSIRDTIRKEWKP
jgi:hypothetical protein